ncbi:MAG: low specificity L-threonine aldolase [Actinobacteria bacterium]|nr:low specificity L-threonine aldolase [Actinomycetota bacterium]
MTTVELRSDNAAGVAPQVLAAVAAANTGSALGYGGDDVTARLEQRVREVFEHPTARVFPVVTGTAANALALSAMCPPWGAVLCHAGAHILTNEANATAMFGGGVLMHGVPGEAGRLSADGVRAALDAVWWGDNHVSQPAVVSLTQATEQGTLYPVAEVAAVAAVAAGRGMRVHLDGARFANAVAALGCTPADLTWRAGVSTVSLGAIKNGGLSAEAVVTFDDAVAAELYYRTKRAGQVSSKMRFQSAQLLAYLTDDLWLHLAGSSNRAMARLADGLTRLGAHLEDRPEANIAFVRADAATADRLRAAGLLFYDTAPGTIRLVTSWQTSDQDVDAALAAFADAL